MALEIVSIVDHLIESSTLQNQINNPAAQFGTPARPHLGATLLPERSVPENLFTESAIKFRSIIANDGTRYNPVQLKKGVLTGSYEVRLGYQDTGSEFTAQEYDAFLRLLQMANGFEDRPAMMAMTQLLNWSEMTLNRPLRDKIEKQRWEVMVYAKVVRTGDNGYQETVTIANPPGHRVNAGDWHNPNYDPFDDIVSRVEFLKRKGYTCNRIITDTPSIRTLALNAKIRQRLGLLSVVGGIVTGLKGRASIADINGLLTDEAMPSLETYDTFYQTEYGQKPFFPRGTMVFVCTTGRDSQVVLGPDVAPVILPDTLGYVAIGRPAGQTDSIRVVKMEAFDRKPPRIEGESWQASFPVVQEPEAIAVLLNIPVTQF